MERKACDCSITEYTIESGINPRDYALDILRPPLFVFKKFIFFLINVFFLLCILQRHIAKYTPKILISFGQKLQSYRVLNTAWTKNVQRVVGRVYTKFFKKVENNYEITKIYIYYYYYIYRYICIYNII